MTRKRTRDDKMCHARENGNASNSAQTTHVEQRQDVPADDAREQWYTNWLSIVCTGLFAALIYCALTLVGERSSTPSNTQMQLHHALSLIATPTSQVHDFYRHNTQLVKAAVYFVDPLAERATWAFNDYEEDDQKRISTDEWIDTKDLAKRVREHGDGLPKSNVMEALATLEAAINYRQAGKYTKAQRLLDHALALAPSDPDILTEYGIYHEYVTKDLVKAESMYTRALVQCPNHKSALINHMRTRPLVEDIDMRMLSAIDAKRAYFLGIPRMNAHMRRAMRDDYFAHVYHTVAIEGNSMNYIQTRSILETKLAIAGKSVVEHNEILGMDAALRFLNRTLINRIGRLTVEDILDIHRRVLGFVDPVAAGHFRTSQVYVGDFAPVPPAVVGEQMRALVDWLNDESSLEVHPVELAALAHYKFVYIHPFIDGNGRTARLLMNLLLMQAGFPPVIIRVDDRLHYYDALKAANDGDVRPFIRLVARATDHALDVYINAVSSQTATSTVLQ